MSRLYLPTQFVLPQDEDQKTRAIQEYLAEIAVAVNSIEQASVSPPKAPAPPAPAPPLTESKTIDCGALPNNTGKFVNHGIPFTASSQVKSIVGIAENPGVAYMNLPFADPNYIQYNVALLLFSRQILVLTAVNYSRFTRSHVKVEYIL